MKAFSIYTILTCLSACVTMSMSYKYMAQECKCMCSGYTNQNVCEHLRDLRLEMDANTEELKRWVQFYPFVQHLKEKWREEIATIVENEVQKYLGDNNLPKPEYLVMDKEDDMLNDINLIPKHTDGDDELAKNVSSLLAKVEKVENRTMEVEEELKSERRVRRHLEQDLKETQSSLLSLGDQLQNVTVPMDAMMNHVQMVLFSSLEDMNKTIYEDHLQKLYYKVDGVVYQNETRELGERLNHVETELHINNESLVNKLAEDVKLLQDNLDVLNSSVGSNITPRLSSLEREVVKRDIAEGLEQRISNNTELFNAVWSDIIDFKNFQQKMHNFSEDWRTSLETIQLQIEEMKKDMSIDTTGIYDIVTSDNIDSEINVVDVRKIDTLNVSSINIIEVRKVGHMNNMTHGLHFEEDIEYSNEAVDPTEVNILNDTIHTADIGKVENFTEEIDIVRIHKIGDLNDTDSYAQVFDVTSVLPPTESLLNEVGIENEVYITSSTSQTDKNSAYDDSLTCDPPNIDDLQLVTDFEKDENNRTNLVFGCRSIGQYAVIDSPVPLRCEDGMWKGPLPSCRKLASEKEIEDMSEGLQNSNPCLLGIGEFPDPTDCSRFFKCSHGTATVMPCPHGLHFNPDLLVCDYPKAAGCLPVENEMFQTLNDLIPPILIEPNNLDKPNGLMGTGSGGQLIVHPRSSFTLHCMYPEFFQGYPIWNVTYFRPSAILRHISKDGTNRISLKITAAKEEDSGIYRCETPFGKDHSIRVVVKAVLCPPIELGEEYEDVFYRPTPEGEQRILGTTAEFQCEEGGRASVLCLATGNWSSHLPHSEECTPKRRKLDGGWNCSPFDTSLEPNLILEKNDIEKTIVFKCAGRLQLIGNSFTRCRDDGLWSHTALPECL